MSISGILEGMDEDQAQQLLGQISDEAITNALQTGIEKEVIPELQEIRTKIREMDEDAEEARQYLENLSEEEQQERFNAAVTDLLSVLTEIRVQPLSGGEKLKERLRDPWTTESLLLIFDHPDVPDEVVESQKDFAATWLRWAGANAVPEMYEEEELEEIVETLYPDAKVEEAIDLVESEQAE
jgi:cytochrome P450